MTNYRFSEQSGVRSVVGCSCRPTIAMLPSPSYFCFFFFLNRRTFFFSLLNLSLLFSFGFLPSLHTLPHTLSRQRFTFQFYSLLTLHTFTILLLILYSTHHL